MDWKISTVDLTHGKEVLFHELLEKQKISLSRFGIKDVILMHEDLQIVPGTYSIIATDTSSKEMIGGARIYTRSENHCLPLEANGSFLPEEFRGIIRAEKNICEVRGLWVSAEFSGRTLAKEIMSQAILHCYRLGYDSVVGTAQIRTFKHLGEPLGFKKEINIPALPFPDERFETNVYWHRKDAMSALVEGLSKKQTSEAC